MEYNRPDPDELLASLKLDEEQKNKGKLKIFFGMCSGVGKTYTMLKTARTDKAKGLDIAIGYVESHDRKETNALLEDFEIIPRKIIDYKGTKLQEMDIDSVIERHPQIVVVDELAHTNAPGSKHLKRYQDVLELIGSGIDVYTTVNVQHLESRVDIVSQITGIIVRESLPDEIFEKADEVELIDITPDVLLGRLTEGKVYTQEHSQEAIHNFFRKGNITALREMALRIVAERVDKQLRSYMLQKKIPGPWKSGLRLMVAIGPSPSSAKLIRWAKNLSYTMGATMLALSVETSQSLTEKQKEQLNKNIKLAKQLGAEFLATSGNDLVKTILTVARKQNITHIIVGKPRKRNIFTLFSVGNFVQRLIRYSGNIDIYVLGSDLASDNKYKNIISFPIFKSGIAQYMFSSLLICSVALGCFPLLDYIGYQSVSFILLFVVSILATFMGIGPILVASTLSALIWDFFFIPPKFTLHINKPEDLLMLGMFFFIALINGVLTYRVRKQEKLTRDREERTYALYLLTKNISKASTPNELINFAMKDIKKYFGFDAAFILQDGNNKLNEHTEGETEIKLSANDISCAIWTFKHFKNSGKYTDTLPSGELTFYPLAGTKIKPGVIAIKQTEQFQNDKEIFWDTFVNQISNAIEREFLNTLAHKAQFLDESDKLYKTLFNSISHELKIPVSTIMGVSDSLLTTEHNKEVNNELYNEIYKASLRLNRLIENLLNMSRLESGRLTIRLDWCDIRDLVNKVVNNIEEELKSFNIHIVIPDDMPLVKIDFGLMEQVLYNLVYNASQYGTPGSSIRIKTYCDNGNFIIQVMDRGPGLPADALTSIFNKFYRVEHSKAGGTGLGLSIVKGFVDAHKGTVVAENRANGGAIFTVKIPSEIPEIRNIN